MTGKISDYKIINILGEGGFGKAYSASKDGKMYVIKQINNVRDKNSAEIQVLKKIAKSGCSPDILCYVEDFIEKNKLYIVTEMFEKSYDLYNFLYLKRQLQKLSFYDLLLIFYNTTESLKKLHDMKIAHLDIKPDNILINSKTLDIQLIDFGMACDEEMLAKCRAGGTIDYLSPEMLYVFANNEKSLSSFKEYIKSDIFSLGILFYSMIYNTTPMDEYNENFDAYEFDISSKMLLDKYKNKKIGELLKEDGDINSLIIKMLNFDYKKRPDIDYISDELDRIVKIYYPQKSFKLLETKKPSKKTSVTKKPSKKTSVTKKPSKKTSVTKKPSKKASITKKVSKKASITKKVSKKAAKTKKPKEAKVKVCPEDKEINPKTGRCIKKCKAGFERDPITFKCKKIK